MPPERLKYQARMYTIDDAIEDMRDYFCVNCSEYKGMVEDPETGDRYCVFCE